MASVVLVCCSMHRRKQEFTYARYVNRVRVKTVRTSEELSQYHVEQYRCDRMEHFKLVEDQETA